ncbi:MAG: glycoside hydrolase 5 family protein [Anaerolineae bacterium]
MQPTTTTSDDGTILLVIDDALWQDVGDALPPAYRVMPRSRYDAEAVLAGVAAGGSLVWIGSGEGIPADLAVGSFRPATHQASLRVLEGSPLELGALPWQAAAVASAFLRPPKEMPRHNIDEEVRADFLPILAAYDRFGQLVGYPGVLMHYYAPSLVGRRFGGSACYFFLFDDPARALEREGWLRVLACIALRQRSGVQIVQASTDYASYRVGERVRLRVRLHNARTRAAAVEVRCYAQAPGGEGWRELVRLRRCPEGGCESEAIADVPAPAKPGLWTLRAEVWADADLCESLALTGNPQLIDRRDAGIVVLEGALRTPTIVELDGPAIRIEGQDGFWAGTHYYPSSSWWEWLWREFDPLKAAADLDAMRRIGYRLVRVWIDPILDEQVLRAMDAAIYLAARCGLVLDVCLFTQWVRTIGFENPTGELVTFDFRHRADFNLYSISLRNLDLQRAYVGVPARRWREAGNVVYNLANEVYLKDPDGAQMDAEAQAWEGIPAERGEVRDTLLFRRWAAEMTAAMRAAGATQAVIPGYMFSLVGGGDNYLGNQDADIVPWHNYLPPEQTAHGARYFDPSCARRPLIIEEFGVLGWNSATNYDANAHYALAGGAAAALSYEWGVSWLAREVCYGDLPLRDALVEESDPRWFEPAIAYAREFMPEQGAGLCPWPSGFAYGSVYHGTPFPAEAALALGRLGLMGLRLGAAAPPERAYVLVPTGRTSAFARVQETFQALWRGQWLFGVWQEADLERLPASVEVVICPVEPAPASRAWLQVLACTGVEVYLPGQDWSISQRLSRVAVEPASEVDLLARRTGGGTLYALFCPAKGQRVTLDVGAQQVSLGLESFGLVHEREGRIRLVEAAGSVCLDGRFFCEIASGRAFVASEDAPGLADAERLHILVIEPTRLTFARPIQTVAVLDGVTRQPVGALEGDGLRRGILEVDAEAVRYLLAVRLERAGQAVTARG